MNTPDGWPIRFSSKVLIEGIDDCWIWKAVTIPSGYGQYWSDGRMVNSHRMALELIGKPIPLGYVVMHSCDNPACCNPAHLSAVKQIDNLSDMKAKGRSLRGERHNKAILTERGVLDIRASKANAPTMARKYGVAVATIHDIRHGRSWTHLL